MVLVPSLLDELTRFEQRESAATIFQILSTSRIIILGLNSTNGEGFMHSPLFSSGTPLEKEIPLY